MGKEVGDIQKKYLRKLEDILNTCESLVEKVGHLQVDLLNNPDKDLEECLEKLNCDFSSNHQYITQVLHLFEDKVSK